MQNIMQHEQYEKSLTKDSVIDAKHQKPGPRHLFVSVCLEVPQVLQMQQLLLT